MNIISFGSPRSGTTFIEKMFLSSSFDCQPGFTNYVPDLLNKVDFSKIKFLSDVDNYTFKIGETACVHPINSQVNFNKLCKFIEKPVTIIRTYRSAKNIFHSLEHIGNGINIDHRFKAWDLNSICAMLIAEYASYIAIKDDYTVLNVDFDRMASKDYVNFIFKDFPEFHSFIYNNYNKVPVRRGILAEKPVIRILNPKEEEMLFKVDKIRSII